MIPDRNAALRSILTGTFAFGVLVALIGCLMALHLRNFRIFGIPLPTELILLGVFSLTIVVGKTAKGHAWWCGLLAGTGMGVPSFLVGLYILAPDPRTWMYMLGRPSCELWMGFLSILSITSLGAQSAALWLKRHRLLAFFTAAATIGCVIAIWICGFRIMRHLATRTQALQALNERPGFDMPLPDLELTRLDGTSIPATELKGHITVLDFWGTWCGACIAEFPSLEAASKEYSGNPKVRFLLVNPELEGDTLEKIQLFLKRKQITIPIALDPGTPYFKLSSKLHNEGLPMLLIVDQRGHIRLYRYGFDTGDKTRQLLKSNIDNLLASSE